MPTFTLTRTYNLNDGAHLNSAEFSLTAEQYTLKVSDNGKPFHEETRDISALAEVMQSLFEIDYHTAQ